MAGGTAASAAAKNGRCNLRDCVAWAWGTHHGGMEGNGIGQASYGGRTTKYHQPVSGKIMKIAWDFIKEHKVLGILERHQHEVTGNDEK